MVGLEEGYVIGLLLFIFDLPTETIEISFVSSALRSTYTVRYAVETGPSILEARGTWVSVSTLLCMFHNVSHSPQQYQAAVV